MLQAICVHVGGGGCTNLCLNCGVVTCAGHGCKLLWRFWQANFLGQWLHYPGVMFVCMDDSLHGSRMDECQWVELWPVVAGSCTPHCSPCRSEVLGLTAGMHFMLAAARTSLCTLVHAQVRACWIWHDARRCGCLQLCMCVHQHARSCMIST